jgi:hypothetical protein
MSRVILVLTSLLALGGCASIKLPAPTPNVENVTVLRNAGIGKTGVSSFTLAAGKKPAIDKSVGVRGSSISPDQGTFSSYLAATLRSDLQAADKYDANSPTVILGELLDNQLHAAGVSEADAALSVRFRVKRSSDVLYEKVIDQRASWKSSFVGAIAIPDAINHFGEQFRLILLQLYRDPQFQAALKPGSQ